MKNSAIQDTALKIMNAAEALFVKHGFSGTSMRMITDAAQVNLAAVNYHFGAKKSLYQAVYGRRLNHFCKIAIFHLDQAEAKSPKLSVTAVVQAFLQAGCEMCVDSEAGGYAFVRLLSRAFAESCQQLKQLRKASYEIVADRYTQALQQALPALTAEEIVWRLHFLATTTFNTFAGNDAMRFFVNDSVINARDPVRVAQYLLPYLVGGLKADGVMKEKHQIR